VKLAIHLTREAYQEIRAAEAWYEEREEGLGGAFVAAIDETLERVRRLPKAFPFLAGSTHVRRALTKRFPYVLAFQVRDSIVDVLSIGHRRRGPGYWKARMSR
jgi:ParE-like toxin of type II ParDE toxin-antitoxin system